MKIYIAGRITGDPDYADKFYEAAEELRASGHIVLNPATLPKGLQKPDYMRLCLPMLDTADLVYFLPGWGLSPGARLEMEYCRYCEKAIFIRPCSQMSNLDTEADQADLVAIDLMTGEKTMFCGYGPGEVPPANHPSVGIMFDSPDAYQKAVDRVILRRVHEAGFNYIAQDESGLFCAYRSRPYRRGSEWVDRDGYVRLFISPGWCSWEDEAPNSISTLLRERKR